MMTDFIRRLETPNLAPVTATSQTALQAPSLAPEIAPRLSRDALALVHAAPRTPTSATTVATPITPPPIQAGSSAQALVLAAREGHSSMQVAPRELSQWVSLVDKLRRQGRPDAEIQRYLAACFGSSYENQARAGFVGPVPSLRDASRRQAVHRHEVPYISQRRPAGAGPDYRNGAANCAPASMAMVARAFGYRDDLNDAQLITHFARIGGTNRDGTTVDGTVAMAQAMRRRVALGDTVPEPYWIASQLEKGGLVVAIGNPQTFTRGSATFLRGGHAIAVVGVDSYGRYLVNDPGSATRNHHPVTPHSLQFFIQSNLETHAGAIAIF